MLPQCMTLNDSANIGTVLNFTCIRFDSRRSDFSNCCSLVFQQKVVRFELLLLSNKSVVFLAMVKTKCIKRTRLCHHLSGSLASTFVSYQFYFTRSLGSRLVKQTRGYFKTIKFLAKKHFRERVFKQFQGAMEFIQLIAKCNQVDSHWLHEPMTREKKRYKYMIAVRSRRCNR